MILAQDLVNRAIDALGLPERIIGDINDGSTAAEMAKRQYGPLLRELLRVAHWSFARFSVAMQLLGDATGAFQTPQGTPYSNQVEQPWLYAYAWPIDCVKPIWLPWNAVTNSGVAPPGNIVPASPNVPLMTGLNQLPSAYASLMPARFLSATSAAFPILVGQASWDAVSDASSGEGVGIRRRRVILTNVPPSLDANQNPIGPALVYTGFADEPSLWDGLFNEAFVASLAERMALGLTIDPEGSVDDQAKQRAAALQVRAQQIAIAKNAIREARAASANEAGFPQNAVHQADWIRAHRIFGPGPMSGGGGGPGYLWYGWDSMAFSGGESF